MHALGAISPSIVLQYVIMMLFAAMSKVCFPKLEHSRSILRAIIMILPQLRYI